MEASENAGTPLEGTGGSPLHRIDLDRVTRLVREGAQSPGFNRLQTMVAAVIPRLIDVPSGGDRASRR